ncbi:hypothetical protein mRhiFer1_010246 [Rhinolophus ferrumequinum]|uniref:Uncharacterized protein n=1 Tax=Rhinolophus ferrumequinum TaxID=59479 RepID=A0A7J7X6D8_RHIFE|nr:hypothetical protein mRhiFer1_010246 [Rhinolophus ferrumequinum]
MSLCNDSADVTTEQLVVDRALGTERKIRNVSVLIEVLLIGSEAGSVPAHLLRGDNGLTRSLMRPSDHIPSANLPTRHNPCKVSHQPENCTAPGPWAFPANPHCEQHPAKPWAQDVGRVGEQIQVRNPGSSGIFSQLASFVEDLPTVGCWASR